MLTTSILILLAPIALAQTADPSSQDCLDCHDEMAAAQKRTVHPLTGPVSCTSCHSGGAVHIDDPEVGNIGNPAGQPAAQTESLCTACHQPHMQSDVSGFDPHAGETISCTDCHKIHGNHQGLLTDEEGGFCAKCHVSVVNQFRRRSNHPLTDQAVTCLSCHDFTGNNEAGFGHGPNSNCSRCHPEEGGPFINEHQAVSSFATEGAGCSTCHEPHGSAHERLLTQPGDGLCRQCHGLPPAHVTTHDGIGTRFSCVECHSQVHGSHDSRAFLDPDLGTKIGDEPGSCYCHAENEF